MGPVKWGFETLGKRGGEESGHDIWNKRKKKIRTINTDTSASSFDRVL